MIFYLNGSNAGHYSKNNVIFAASVKSYLHIVSHWCNIYSNSSSTIDLWRHPYIRGFSSLCNFKYVLQSKIIILHLSFMTCGGIQKKGRKWFLAVLNYEFSYINLLTVIKFVSFHSNFTLRTNKILNIFLLLLKGRFEILCLSGSYLHSDVGSSRGQTLSLIHI